MGNEGSLCTYQYLLVPCLPVYGLMLPLVLQLFIFELSGSVLWWGATYAPFLLVYPLTLPDPAKDSDVMSVRVKAMHATVSNIFFMVYSPYSLLPSEQSRVGRDPPRS